MRPRIRTIKPEMFEDERIVALSRDARLLLLGLITMADDEGRFRSLRSVILGHVFPADDDAPKKVDGWVREVEQSGIVIFYTVGRTPYGAFRHWKRHQRINKPTPSELPEPPVQSVVDDNRATKYDAAGNFKKTAIPERVRRAVAKAAGATPGETTYADCHWCKADGLITWARLADGRPGSWVQFRDLELDHLVPESEGGASTEDNIVLACPSCNRRRGNRHGDSHPDHGSPHGSDHGTTHDGITGSPTRTRALRSDPSPEVVQRLCLRLADHVRRNDPKADPKPDSDRWLTDMRLLVGDRTGDVAEVERILDWCQDDSFWRSNILSPGKLRQQFTQLVLKASPRGEVVPLRRESPSDLLRAINGEAS